jgi:DinB superfamily
MAGKRAASLLDVMLVIELYTLQRMWKDLTDDELFWEPVPGAWGIRRRAECRTPTPFGEGDWVVDFDADLAVAADEGKAVEPPTTIGWLLWHIGSMPGRLAEVDFLGGTVDPASGWTSPYRSAHPVFTSADEAVATMRNGWRALDGALRRASDEQLEQVSMTGFGPASGSLLVAALLNEISHHGSQICQLRDLYRARGEGADVLTVGS